MSYTTDRQPQGIVKDVEGFLREGMIAEIVAINDYSNFISLTDNKEVRDIFHHIMEEEKEHYGLFLQALRCIDPEQEELEKEVKTHMSISSRAKYKYKYYNYEKDKNNLLTYIRESLKGELEAILLYEFFIANIENPSIKKIIKEITRDEKEHVEELTKALIILDTDKYGPIS